MTTAPVTRNLAELQTPAPLVDAAILASNLARMAQAWPGERVRPHVKAHKCTELARQQRSSGHPGFTCATIREVEGMVAAGLGQDLLLANEVLEASRLGALVAAGARVTVAVDSPATVRAAQRAGLRAGRYPTWATRSVCCRRTSTPRWPTMSAFTWSRVSGSWKRGRWTCEAGDGHGDDSGRDVRFD
jgi:diaminopimelate decarboxylase